MKLASVPSSSSSHPPSMHWSCRSALGVAYTRRAISARRTSNSCGEIRSILFRIIAQRHELVDEHRMRRDADQPGAEGVPESLRERLEVRWCERQLLEVAHAAAAGPLDHERPLPRVGVGAGDPRHLAREHAEMRLHVL